MNDFGGFSYIIFNSVFIQGWRWVTHSGSLSVIYLWEEGFNFSEKNETDCFVFSPDFVLCFDVLTIFSYE